MLVKGINRDVDPINIPKGQSPYILNGNLTDEFGSVTNEHSNVSITNLSATAIVLGECVLDNRDKVLFVYYQDTKESQIVRLAASGNIADVTDRSSLLNLNVEHQIQATFRLNQTGQRLVYWTDDYNPPRWINVDIHNTLTVDNLKIQNIFAYYNPAQIILQSVNDSGGSFKSGVYQAFVSYTDKNNNETPYFAFSNDISVVRATKDLQPNLYDGVASGESTSKSITLLIGNLDPAYSKVNVGLVYYKDGIIDSVKIYNSFSIMNNDIIVTLTNNETTKTISIDELLAFQAVYDTAKTINQLEDKLYLANLTETDDLPMQKYVNSIKVDAVVSEVTMRDYEYSDTYRSETTIFSLRGFQHDETYALYISFILDNGRETKAYHIPGRPVSTIHATSVLETDVVNDTNKAAILAATGILTTTYDDMKHVGTNPKIYQIFSTAGYSGVSNMGYWQNDNETYPDNDNWEVWDVDGSGNGFQTGSIKTQNVRHHKFPAPVIDINYLQTTDVTKSNILGLRLSNICIPKEFKDKIKYAKIYYAKRSVQNATVLGNSIGIYQAGVVGDENPYLNTTLSQILTKTYSVPGTNSLENGPDFRIIPNKKAVRYFAPEMMFNSIDIKTITHFKNYADFVGNRSPVYTYMYGTGAANGYWKVGSLVDYVDQGKTFYGPGSPNNGSRRVKSMFYSQFGTTEAIESNSVFLNTYHDVYSYQVEKDVFVEFYNELDTPANGPTFDVSFPATFNVDDLQSTSPALLACAWKTDVYVSFEDQELVDTGTLIYFDSSVHKYTQTNIFGGDTFIDLFGIRTTSDIFKAPLVTDNDQLHAFQLKTLHYFPTQSTVNTYFRYEGTAESEIYYPKSVLNTITDVTVDPETGKGVLDLTADKQNWLAYNNDYSRVNDLFQPGIISKDTANNNSDLPTRIIRSDVESTTSNIDNFRRFLPNNAVDLYKNRGEIENLARVQDNLIIQLTNSATKTVARETLNTTDTTAFLGTADIFTIPVKDIIYTDIGYGGTNTMWANISTPYGLIYPDSEKGKVYMLGSQIEEISSNGLIKWSLENFKLQLYEQLINRTSDISFPLLDNICNPKGIGFTACWDEKYRRYIVTKKDFIFNDTQLAKFNGVFPQGTAFPASQAGDIYFNTANNTFVVLVVAGPYAIPEVITFTDTTYFIDKGFTISYYPEFKCWGSFYSYRPYKYIFDRQGFLSFNEGDVHIYKHNVVDSYCRFYGTKHNFELDVVYNDEPDQSKQFSSITYASKFKDLTNNEIITRTFDQFYIYNSYQASGYTDITNLETARLVNNVWNVSQFRNLRSDYTVPVVDKDYNITAITDINKNWYEKERISDKYTIGRLIYNNTNEGLFSFLLSETFDNLKGR